MFDYVLIIIHSLIDLLPVFMGLKWLMDILRSILFKG